MERMIARCGLICTECPAYIATKANDPAAIDEVVLLWREAHDPNITAEQVWCDGCLSDGPHHCGHWSDCGVQTCASSRGVLNCAVCDDYGCEIITAFTNFVPQAKEMLEQIRAAS